MFKQSDVTFSFEGAEYRDKLVTALWGRFTGQAKSIDGALSDLIANMRKQHLVYEQVSTNLLSEDGNKEKTELFKFFSLEPPKGRNED